jgi:hypothetical protein
MNQESPFEFPKFDFPKIKVPGLGGRCIRRVGIGIRVLRLWGIPYRGGPFRGGRGAAAVMTPGTGLCPKEDGERLYREMGSRRSSPLRGEEK